MAGIKKRTCLVLGAGASVPYGLPSGWGLRKEIVEGLTPIRDLLIDCGFDTATQEALRIAFMDSGQPSIDAFLELRPEFTECGKAIMVAMLVPCERREKLGGRDSEQWYTYLYQQMGLKSLDDVARTQLTIVTFNYDRSLEYYLEGVLRNSFGVTEGQAAKALSTLPIVHVHGRLGAPHFWSEQGRDFVPAITPELVLKHARDIRILHEQGSNSPEFAEARKLIYQAEVVCFLGFAYHELNVKRLMLHWTLFNQVVVGSALGLAPDEVRKVRRLFEQEKQAVNLTLGDEHEDALRFLRSYPVFG